MIKNKKISDSCIILFYHSIQKKYQKNFIKQLDYIQSKTTPVNIDFNDFKSENKRYSVLTFDDAFQSVIKYALPELYQRKIPSTIFVPVGCLGKKPEWLKDIDHPEKNEIVASALQLRELNNEFVSIGSHSVNHPNLTTLSESEIYHELYGSKTKLEKLVSYPINNIAFPFGAYNSRILELCKKTGYKHVFTTKPNIPYSSTCSFEKGRVGINPWDWTIEYRLKILGAYSWMPYISKIKNSIKYLFISPPQ